VTLSSRRQGGLSGCLAGFWRAGQASATSAPDLGDWCILYMLGKKKKKTQLRIIRKGSSSTDHLEGNNFPLIWD